MAEKTLNSRLIMKHDSSANWAKATSFVPKKGEIIIYDGSGATASKFKIGDGSTTVVNLPFAGGGSQAATGSATMPIYWDGTQYKTINSFPEKYLSWGGKSIVADVSPIDAAMTNVLGGVRSNLMLASGIIIEYSTNGGSTWADYGATNTDKVALVSEVERTPTFSLGKHLDGATRVNDQLRITIDGVAGGVYFALKTLCIYMTTGGAGGCKCKIEHAQGRAGATSINDLTFVTDGTYNINGWSGWNSIPCVLTYGGTRTRTDNSNAIRLTFTIDTAQTTDSQRCSIFKVFMLGTIAWSAASTIAKTGHLYSWTVNKEAIFPAAVTATAFNGNATSATKVNGHTVNSDVPANAKFTDTVYTLPAATSSVLGGVKIGSGITVAADGTISAASSYTLPTASTTVKGGIKVGTGLTMSSETLNHSNSITAKTAYGSTATTASANGGSITVTDVKYDAQGHITGSTDRKITLSQTTYTLAGLGGVPTSRTINGKALSSNITLTAGDVGAATSSALNSYLPLSGGSITGNLTVGGTFTYTNIGSDNDTSDYFKLWMSTAGVPKRCDYLYFNPAEKMLAVQGNNTASPMLAVEALGSNTVSIALKAEVTGNKGIINRVNNGYMLHELGANNFLLLGPSARDSNYNVVIDTAGDIYRQAGGTNYRVWNQYNMKSGTSLPASANAGDIFFLYS